MRISLDVRHLALPGIGRFATELDRALVGRARGDPDVVTLLPRGSARGWLGRAAFNDPAGQCQLRVWSRPFGLAEQAELPARLRRARVELHHSTFLSVPRAAGVPVVLTVHDLFPLVHPEHARSAAATAYYRLVLPEAVKRATATVAVSEFTAAEMERVLHVRPDAVIGHGVDHGAWAAPGGGGTGAAGGAGPAPAGKLPAGPGTGRPYLLYVGTAKPHKNLATVLRAHRAGSPGAAPDRLPLLVLAGPTPEEVAALDPGSMRSGRVRALGRVPDACLPPLYAGAVALVMPSLYEAVGLAALEAMSFGVPVIAADAPGLRETVGDAAALVPPLDVGAWEEALRSLTQDGARRSALIGRGWERAAGRRWADAADAYVALYHSVLGL